jgi:hypothetical protein
LLVDTGIHIAILLPDELGEEFSDVADVGSGVIAGSTRRDARSPSGASPSRDTSMNAGALWWRPRAIDRKAEVMEITLSHPRNVEDSQNQKVR